MLIDYFCIRLRKYLQRWSIFCVMRKIISLIINNIILQPTVLYHLHTSMLTGNWPTDSATN